MQKTTALRVSILSLFLGTLVACGGGGGGSTAATATPATAGACAVAANCTLPSAVSAVPPQQ